MPVLLRVSGRLRMFQEMSQKKKMSQDALPSWLWLPEHGITVSHFLTFEFKYELAKLLMEDPTLSVSPSAILKYELDALKNGPTYSIDPTDLYEFFPYAKKTASIELIKSDRISEQCKRHIGEIYARRCSQTFSPPA
jgi:hypothetical protein